MGKYQISKPQKSSKHKKIKPVDPFYIGSRPIDKRDAEANRQPKNAEEQEIPQSVKEMMWLKNKVSKSKTIKQKKSKGKALKKSVDVTDDVRLERGMSRPLKPAPEFKQHRKETDKMFMRRVERETQAVINRAKFEDKYNVELDYDKDGKTVVNNVKNNKKKAKEKERLKQKKLAKKQKVQDDRKHKDFEQLQDEVEFGEVAMAPPSLTAKPRKASAAGSAGKKSSLLLLEKLQPVVRKVGEVEKKKNMSMARQLHMDAERNRAIELYRKMKARKTAMN